VAFVALDPEAAEVVMAPEAPGAGYWVGAPSVLWHGGRVLLTYRRRRPRGMAPDRGYRAAVAISTDGLHFEDVAVLEKGRLGTTSIERTALVPPLRAGEPWTWLVSYVDPADGRWRIDALRAERLEDLPSGQREPVLTAADIGGEGVKDPVVVGRGPDGTLWLLVSCAAAVRAPGRSPTAEELHGTHDAYNTGLVRCFTGLASSVDGRHWRWHGACLEPGTGWDRYQARLGCAVPVGPGWVGLYDGSASVEENYEERLGVAWSPDLVHWRSLTPDGPAVVSRGASGSVRYADVLPAGAELWVYFECSRPDGAHDLRRARLRWKVGEGGPQS
jgi:hypothetical protein